MSYLIHPHKRGGCEAFLVSTNGPGSYSAGNIDLTDQARAQVGKWIVSLEIPPEVSAFFGAARTVRKAVVDDFGNLVAVP